MPRVSVILNCYNHAPYVAEAVESVLAQGFTDFELILIDNGSTDGTRAVLERFGDPRIRRFFHDENQSLSKRLNEGVAAAKGEFVAVLYSDDLMLPDKLERQVGLFDSLPKDYGVVYCPAIGFNQFTGKRWVHGCHGISGTMFPRWFTEHWRGHIDMSSPLTRRECLVQSRWFEDLPFDGEAVFMRIGLRWKFSYDTQPTVMLRDHDTNAGKLVKRNHDMAVELLKRFRQLPNYPPELDETARHFEAQLLQRNAWLALRTSAQNRRWARTQLMKSIKADGGILREPRTIAGLIVSILPTPAVEWLNQRFDRRSAFLGNAPTADEYAR